jgi:DnaJ-class molecular chaperone
MTYLELRQALEIFGLGEQATLAEIKQRHRELVKRYHPDSGGPRERHDHPPAPATTGEAQSVPGDDQALIRRINAAYRILTDYVNSYSFSFSQEEFFRQNPEARLHHQFDQDPIWGPGDGRP